MKESEFFEKYIVGTWWYGVYYSEINKSNVTYIKKATKLEVENPKTGTARVVKEDPKNRSSWIFLKVGDKATNPINSILTIGDETVSINARLFKKVQFPELTPADGPKEIEIVKSGKVYIYD
jgi:hypothetical protein